MRLNIKKTYIILFKILCIALTFAMGGYLTYRGHKSLTFVLYIPACMALIGLLFSDHQSLTKKDLMYTIPWSPWLMLFAYVLMNIPMKLIAGDLSFWLFQPDDSANNLMLTIGVLGMILPLCVLKLLVLYLQSINRNGGKIHPRIEKLFTKNLKKSYE